MRALGAVAMSRRHDSLNTPGLLVPLMGFGKDGKLSILYDFGAQMNSSSLAALDVLAAGGRYHNLLIDDFRMIRINYNGYLEGGEAGDSLVFGIASSDLSALEIEQCLEGAWVEESNRISQEITERPVWILGKVNVLASPGDTPFQGEFKAETIRWTFHQQSGWQWWVFNPSAASAIGSSSTFVILSKIFGVWVR